MEKTLGIGLVGLGFGKQVLAINADTTSALAVRGIRGRRSAATAIQFADMPDNFLISLRFASGALGRILCARGVVAPPMPVQDNLNVFGSRGSVVGNQVVLDRLQNTPTLTLSYPPDGPGGSVVCYLKHFEACLHDDRSPLVDAYEGARGWPLWKPAGPPCAAVASLSRCRPRPSPLPLARAAAGPDRSVAGPPAHARAGAHPLHLASPPPGAPGRGAARGHGGV